MLTYDSIYLLVLFRATLFCPNVAFCSMTKVFVTVPTVSDNLGALYTVQFIRGWQAIIREDSKVQNAGFKSCNLLQKYRVLKSS